jgi:hypothetical protein
MTWWGFPLDSYRRDVDIAKTAEFREVPLMAPEDKFSVGLRSALKANSSGFAEESDR